MTQGNLLPALDWPTLLRCAPYFSTAIVDALCRADPDTFAPHVRAVYYFDLFDAQVSNGGVGQYFDNVVARRSDAGQIPAAIAANPVFAQALPLIEEVHAIWSVVAAGHPDVADHGDKGGEDEDDDWDAYEELLAPHASRLEAISEQFYAVHHQIRRDVDADIVRDPHRYFAIAAVPGLRGQGIEHVTLPDGACRMRFEDGFPVGPNTFEAENGHCDVVWFSRDRSVLQAERAGYAAERQRDWIHYPSQASGSWTFGFDFMGDGRSVRNDRLSLGLGHHGLHESFTADGRRESSALYWHGEEMASEHFYPDGTPLLRCRRQGQGEHRTRYWPNGAVNTETIEDRDGRERYLRCLDQDGHDLAPGGTGRLQEMLSLDVDMRQWREGELVGGFLSGDVQRFASHPDGSGARETERTFFKNGRAQ